ncbi:hypothetical protein ACJMK2_042180 [Sinanodonta woodiana]|uniref:SWIM-type domain-containing protein n=1 Tax=Sinanodonta woodiana TaxID=1069815 RepID=A0ABD3W6K1_SINWO
MAAQYHYVSLTEDDVPGAKLPYPLVENHSVVQLKRWLQCRDLTISGNLSDFIKRVRHCIEAGNSQSISISVDGGKWYDLKLKKLKETETQHQDKPKASIPPYHRRHSIKTNLKLLLKRLRHSIKTNLKLLLKRLRHSIKTNLKLLFPLSQETKHQDKPKASIKETETQHQDKPKASIPPVTGWNIFPSVDLPKHFNVGHVHHHIIESVQFTGQTPNTEENEDDDVQDLHTANPLNRGKYYFKSGHVQSMKDCEKNGTYYLKAKVMASYVMSTMYDTMVQISEDSGFVRDASCTCIASSTGRCSHVCALLFAMLDYIEKNGTDVQSCTSKSCDWNKGHKRYKDPKCVSDVIYENIKKQKISDVILYDPTPAYSQQTPQKAGTDLLNATESNSMSSSESMWQSKLYKQYVDYELDTESKALLCEKRRALLQNISIPSSPYPQEIVKEQGSAEWFLERRVRVTASVSKTVSTASNPQSARSILNKILWEENAFKSCAILYGKENEKNAFTDYLTKSRMETEGFSAVKTGLWVNSKYPELACSPDGLVLDPGDENKYGLLEIKCPYILQGKDIRKFDEQLTKKQQSRFCLLRSNGHIELKKNHAYYFQIQTQLGIMGLKWCDFVVWSDINFEKIRVEFDQDFWGTLSEKLISFHHKWLCPEFFEMRIPRRLMPKSL